MSSTSIARVFSPCVLTHERLREEGAAPPLTPPPLPPHATDTCSRCSQVIQSGDNSKITIFNMFWTFSPRCTWASFGLFFHVSLLGRFEGPSCLFLLVEQ